MFGEANNAALYTFIGATMAGNSIATLRLMGFIPAIKGGIDQKGNNRFFLSNGIRMPSYYAPGTQDEDSVRRLKDQLSADKFPLLAGPEALTAPYPHPRQVIDAMLTGKPYPVRALWTSCNPLVSLEDTTSVYKALSGLDLLVVMDIFESPTAHIADYILPMTTHLESDAITEYVGINMVAARQHAVQPLGEVRDEGDVVLDVMRRMGYGDKAPAQTYREMLDYRLEPLGIDFDAFKAMGTYVRENSDRKYATGKLRSDGRNGFNTPSGRIEFTSTVLQTHGYDPLPDFVEPPISPYSEPKTAANYPLIMISGTRSIEYYSTLGIEIDTLRKRRPYPVLEIAPETAAEYGLEDGEWVAIEAPTIDTRIQRKIAIIEGLDPRVVNAEGLWYMPGEDYVEGVFRVGCNVLNPLRDDTDPVIGGSIARCILCRISKLDSKFKAA
jgi:anaerobic selenocysteine-containing dehydrogenase